MTPRSPSDSFGLGRSDLAPLGLLAAMFVLFHSGAILHGETFSYRDLGHFFAPLREITFREIAAGRFPVWNSFSLSGLPLFASPNVALGNPFTWLYALGGVMAMILGTAAAVTAVAYVLLRRLGTSPAAALVGSAVAAFGGAARSSEPFPTTLSCLAWIPLTAFAVHHLSRESSEPGAAHRRAIAVTAAAFALLALAGEPALAIEGLAAAAVVSAIHLLAASRTAARRRILVGLAGAAGLSLLLASFQILPTFRELRRAPRGEGLRAETGPSYWSLPPLRLATLALPTLYGDPFAEADEDDWGATRLDGGGSYLPTIYAGLVPLLLLAAAIGRRAGRASLGIFAGAALLAFGRFTPLGPLLLKFFPPLRLLRYPEKWMILATLALALAAAIGLDELAGDDDPRRDAARKRFFGAAAALAGVLALALAVFAVAPAAAVRFLVRFDVTSADFAPHAVDRLRGDAGFQLALALAVVGAAILVRRPERRSLGVFLLAGIALADLAQWNRSAFPSSARNAYRESDAATEALRTAAAGRPVYYDSEWKGALARRAAVDGGGFDPALPMRGVFHGLRYAGNNEIDRMGPRHAVAWAAVTANLPWGDEKLSRLRTAGVGAITTLASLDGAPGVERVAFAGSETAARHVYRLTAPRDEATLVPNVAFAANPPELDRLVRSNPDPLRYSAVIAPARPRLAGPGGGSVRSTLRSPVDESHEVDSPADALFVRARTFDPDFEASLDGRPAESFLADGMFTAVLVPAGHHTISFRYRNPSIRAGAILSVIGLLSLAALQVRRTTRR